VSEWVSVEDRLPPIVETFKDGTNYHGVVDAWFPHYHKMNCRRVTLWSSAETGQRWSVNGAEYGPSHPPTHWMPLPEAPKKDK
jgi:hypothetical protein